MRSLEVKTHLKEEKELCFLGDFNDPWPGRTRRKEKEDDAEEFIASSSIRRRLLLIGARHCMPKAWKP